jgi:hypothetical protein
MFLLKFHALLTRNPLIFYKNLTFFDLRLRNSIRARQAWLSNIGLVGG